MAGKISSLATAWIPRYLVNFIFQVLPPTRLFRAKRWLYSRSGFRLGSNVKITSECKVFGNGEITIGEATWVGVGAEFHVPVPARVIIGCNCDSAPGVTFLCGTHLVGGPSRRAGEGLVLDIHIGSGVWIGAGSMLLPGCYLEDGIVVAAGSVVTKGRYPANTLLTGNPAKEKKQYAS